jgi:dTDP-4-amino-4,6-dideoxygalactose transaminase
MTSKSLLAFSREECKEKDWNFLPFDSEVLGVRVGSFRNQFDHPKAVQAALEGCTGEGLELLYWTPSNPKAEEIAVSIEKEQWFSGYLVSESVEFQRQLHDHESVEAISKEERRSGDFTIQPIKLLTDNKEGSVEPTIGSSNTDLLDELIDLACVAGRHSRFRRDPAFTSSQFRAMYSAWMHNSLAGEIADQVFVARSKATETDDGEDIHVGKQGTIKGLITVKKCSGDKTNVTIGLLAVSPMHHRQGVGSALMAKALAWAKTQGASKLTVKTQAGNRKAMSFYSSLGYTTVGPPTKMYHIWLTERILENGVRYNVPYFAGTEMREISRLISSNAIDSLGKYTLSCERWLENTLGCSKVLLTPSATAALEAAVLLCNLQTGDEVIMPSFTFVSTANAVALRGATPVFVDVEGTTLNIDVRAVRDAITPKTKAIMVVHYGGEACNMDPIMSLAQEKALFVIEDAAQALLSTYKGRALGTIGHLGCLSFHYTKNTVCGEGGALLVNDDRFHSMSAVIREKGTNRTDFMLSKVSKYEWLSLGSSYVPSELSSAFLFAQLMDAEETARRRREICLAYRALLAPLVENGSFNFKRLSVSGETETEKSRGNGHIFLIILPSVEERIAVQDMLKEHGVQCLTHFVPLHLSKGGKTYGRASGSLEHTLNVHSCLLRLPVWPGMRFGHIHHVVSCLYQYYGRETPSIHTVMHYFLPGKGVTAL